MNIVVIAVTLWLVLGWIGLVFLIAKTGRNRRANLPRPSPIDRTRRNRRPSRRRPSRRRQREAPYYWAGVEAVPQVTGTRTRRGTSGVAATGVAATSTVAATSAVAATGVVAASAAATRAAVGAEGPRWGHIWATNDQIPADNTGHYRPIICPAYEACSPARRRWPQPARDL
jgi:hypothetical protein